MTHPNELADLCEGAEPDAWLYESDHMVFKHRERQPLLVKQGYTETPLFYARANGGEHGR